MTPKWTHEEIETARARSEIAAMVDTETFLSVLDKIEQQAARIEKMREAGYTLRDAITTWGAKSAGQTLPIELAEACGNFMMVAALRDDNAR